ncbi:MULTISPECIES: hypothetical protein [Cyanophyceae]|uniref:hypothetical protein n=1 Tax=Cyanophyceae TaxID=3028117 RepID=UPI001686AEE5|nr:hypothetical protein [Trichocoleus sp. FACHB-40]MBD2003769.1 hypothetical protein [Trichocoleus sp. FACHB-40]
MVIRFSHFTRPDWRRGDRACCVGEDAIALVVEVENAITLVVLGRMRSRFSIGEDAIALCAGEDALYLVCSVRFTRGT